MEILRCVLRFDLPLAPFCLYPWVMVGVEDIDDITDKLLCLLVKEPNFVSEWEERTAGMMVEEVSAKSPAMERRRNRLQEAVEVLIQSVDIASQTFINEESSLYKYTDGTVNRDIGEIYDLELSMQRVQSLESIPSRSKSLEAVVIRISRLAGRKFQYKISNSCHVPHTLKLSTSVCDMLFRIAKALQELDVDREVLKELRRGARDFNEFVVGPLAKWNEELLAKEAKANQSPKTVSPAPRTPKRRPLVEVQRKSPGFLMSPDLVRARARMLKSKSGSSIVMRSRSVTMTREKKPSQGESESRKRSLAEGMQKKWGRLLKADRYLKESIPTEEGQDNEKTRVARRISAQVISELRKTLGDNTTILVDLRAE